jgi:hypothetical protein
MKRPILLAAVSLVVLAAVPVASHAQSNTAGIALAWSECYGSGSATVNKNFACGTNSGAETMYASFIPMGSVDELTAFSMAIDVRTTQGTLPSWWAFGGGCRATNSATIDLNFLANSDCTDPWAGGASGGINADLTGQQTHNDPSVLRLRGVGALAGGTIVVDSTVHYYCAKVNISHAKTTGTGSCAGCSFPACLRIQAVVLSETAVGIPPQARDWRIFNALPGQPASQDITWNSPDPGLPPVCTLVPVKSKTWGQVKSLYR